MFIPKDAEQNRNPYIGLYLPCTAITICCDSLYNKVDYFVLV